MKSDGFRRSVSASRTDRSAGDAPDIGKVARMPGTGIPKRKRRKRKSKERRRGSHARRSRKLVIKLWSVLLSVGVLAILGLAVWLWLRPNMERQSTPGPVLAEWPEDARKTSDFPSPSESDALELVRLALANRDPEIVARFFRPCATPPEGIVEFLKKVASTDGEATRLDWLSSLDANGLSLDGVLITYEDAGKRRNRIALLTPDASGIWRLDFDAFARTVTPPWADLLGGSSQTAQVRVYFAPDSYFNGPFRDDRQWICYGLASPDTEEILLGYCKTGSPQAAALASLRGENSKIARVTLEIGRVPGAEARQFEITRVLAEDWVIGEVPFDEKFK